MPNVSRPELAETKVQTLPPADLETLKKMREELKQSQMQLIDLPMVEFDPKYTQQDAEKYFNNPKVNKRYKLKVN